MKGNENSKTHGVKIDEFSCTYILREINVTEFRCQIIADLIILGVLNFDICEIAKFNIPSLKTCRLLTHQN